MKYAWAKEFILCVFIPVFLFSIIHSLVVSGLIEVSLMDMDLIWMPVFMLFVYLWIAIRSMMMYKDFEHQFVLAKIEGEKDLQEQRLKISGDLHDSLGAQLTFINTILDGLKNTPSKSEATVNSKINMLADLSENSIVELKNTLWVLNAKEIYLQDLKEKILNFIKNASEAKEDVNFNFHFDVLENLNINSEQAVNLFRTVQEIVNNALKYSDATEIKIDIVQNDRNLNLQIADNGKGFDYENEKNKSFGLKNIESRIANISGQLNLETSADNGTKYNIQIKL
ncbi:ATP-binding protein [Flavobacterium sp.]|uniref:sensor histidine kinase n=1 Tax=Flavobacterium sp. TaxID=239 RepID=UPI0026304902|nr:ATP-binding protein [Flavobacterium sp.]MDD3005327.1 histidine kinase [Flavobacterium sp.]